MEREFIEGAVGERARRFCYSAVGRANDELQVRLLKPSRAGFMILLVDILLNMCMQLSNEHIFLHNLLQIEVTWPDLRGEDKEIRLPF